MCKIKLFAFFIVLVFAMIIANVAYVQDVYAQSSPEVVQWNQPEVVALCAPDDQHFTFIVTLTGDEPNYNFDWSFNQNFNNATTVNGVKGDNSLITPRGGDVLYVRWSSDHGSKTSINAKYALCNPPKPAKCKALVADKSQIILGETVNLSITAEDAISYQFRINGTTVQEGVNNTYAFTPSEVGIYQVAGRVKGEDGDWRSSKDCGLTIIVKPKPQPEPPLLCPAQLGYTQLGNLFSSTIGAPEGTPTSLEQGYSLDNEQYVVVYWIYNNGHPESCSKEFDGWWGNCDQGQENEHFVVFSDSVEKGYSADMNPADDVWSLVQEVDLGLLAAGNHSLAFKHGDLFPERAIGGSAGSVFVKAVVCVLPVPEPEVCKDTDNLVNFSLQPGGPEFDINQNFKLNISEEVVGSTVNYTVTVPAGIATTPEGCSEGTGCSFTQSFPADVPIPAHSYSSTVKAVGTFVIRVDFSWQGGVCTATKQRTVEVKQPTKQPPVPPTIKKLPETSQVEIGALFTETVTVTTTEVVTLTKFMLTVSEGITDVEFTFVGIIGLASAQPATTADTTYEYPLNPPIRLEPGMVITYQINGKVTVAGAQSNTICVESIGRDHTVLEPQCASANLNAVPTNLPEGPQPNQRTNLFLPNIGN